MPISPSDFSYEQLVDALTQADMAGDTESAEVLGQMIANREYRRESSPVEAAIQGIGRGASLGFLDELGAGIRAAVSDPIVSGLFGSEIGGVAPGEYFSGMGERYQRALESQREAQQAALREQPGITMAGEFAGGMALPGVGMAKAAAAPTLLRSGARMAPAGAGMGALAGLGYSEAEPFRALGDKEQFITESIEAVPDIATGAAGGAVTAALTPAGGAAARKVVRGLARPITRKARLTNEARDQVQNALAQDIENGYVRSAQDLKDEMQDMGLSVADAGPMTRELTEKLVQQPTPAGRNVENFLTARNKEQYRRMFPRLSEAIGAKDNFAAARRKVITDMTNRADELYDEAYSFDVEVTPEMYRMLRHKEAAPALRIANRLRANRNQPPLTAESVRVGDMVNTQDLDEVVKGMDELVGRHMKSIPTIAREITRPMRDAFRQQIYDQNQAYQRARSFWSGEKLNEEAMDQGLKLFSKDADVTLDIINEMGPSEKAFFKIGALRAIAKKIRGKSDTADATKGIFDNEDKRDAVRAVFGGRRQFDEFMNYIESEQKMFNTFNRATQNSATTRRLMQASDSPQRLAAILGVGATGSFMLGGAAGRLVGRLAQPSRRQLQYAKDLAQERANLLMSQAPETIDELGQRRLQGLLGTGGQPTVGALTGGLLATEEGTNPAATLRRLGQM